MTSSTDIGLKSWLRTLRYSVEYYEDTFGSENNRARENNLRAKNMVMGNDSNDESDDGYENIWDCSVSEKSALKLNNSLESVENVSEVSTNIEGEHSSLNTGLSSMDSTISLEKSANSNMPITDLDYEDNDDAKVKKVKKKPVATPRLSKHLDKNESLYANLPLKINLPVFEEENSDPIYENLPLYSKCSSESMCSSTDSIQLEEEVSLTIQLLENVLDSAANFNEDSDSDDIDSVRVPSVDFAKFEDENKFTCSSSSFEDFLTKDNLEGNEFAQPQELNQRYEKVNRVGAFELVEEQEPCPSYEVKHLPVPKRNNPGFDMKKRFSAPPIFLGGSSDVRRPQSLDSAPCYTKDMNQILHVTKDIYANLNYAKESRLSGVFEEAVVDDLNILKDFGELSVLEEQTFVNTLPQDAVCWMASLVDCAGELEDIMEEKELLKSINQVPKDRTGSPPEHKFPLVDDVEFRKKSENQTNRRSKTTDFDAGRRRQPSPISNPKDFSIQGIVAISNTDRGKPILVKWKEEYILYENENFYRVVKKTKEKELLDSNVIIKSINYPKSKESKEVELKDSKGQIYTLHFQDLKQAKQFMENEKVQVYNSKSTVRKLLLGFFGRRSSREILEKKGIYKNEPIFGNTLRDIYLKSTTNSLVPSFIYQVINLLERPENIKSLGVYRTSGNLAIIQKIRFEVDNGRLNILSQYAKDPDVLTGSLKLFFRELKEPLISRDICDKLLDFAKIDPKQMTSKEHQKIRSILIKNLHEANLETFVVIIRHLLEVIKYKDYNKMDAYNMAICWGPSMVFSVQNDDLSLTADLSKDIVTQSQDATRLVDFFLVYYDLYPAELVTLGKRQRPESISEKIHSLRRQDSKDSVGSFDSNKSQKKSASNLSLSIDEITKKLVEFIEPHISCEGLYRRSGSADKTSKIMKKLNKKKINELEKFKNEVHDLTDALKKYLKEQDSLIHEGTVEMVLRISPDSSHSCLEPNTRQKIINLIEDTPKKDTLIFLLRHLAKVLEYQEQSYNVPKNELINIWTGVLNNQKKSKANNEEFAKFLAVAVKVFNDNLPDIVRSSFNNNGGSPNRNESMDELIKEMTNQHRQAERDRNSRYDNVDSDVGEASILDDKTEQTKL